MAEQDLILVVEDDPVMRRVLTTVLCGHRYRVQAVATGEAGIDAVVGEVPAAVLLDLGLPDIDGVEVCRRIRSQSDVPIVVVTGDGTEHRKVQALDDGADDYITKPFSTPELLARVRVALRHHHSSTASALEEVSVVGDLRIDRTRHHVQVGGHPLSLTPKEFAFLALLATNPGRLYPHRTILEQVWGPAYRTETHYLRVYASQLRKKLGDNPTRPRLITEPGVGYRLIDRDNPHGTART